MRLQEVVGAVAVVGLVIILAVSFTNNDTADRLATGSDPGTQLDPGQVPTSSSPPSTVGTTPDTTPGDTSEISGAASSTSTTAAPASSESGVTTSATTATTSTVPPTTDVAPVPESERDAIAVRVLNGGAQAGGAQFVTDALTVEGFSPLTPRDAAQDATETIVLHAPGRLAEALSVNEVIGLDRTNVVEADPDDENWAQFGGDVVVLVVLGPA